jgi:hypothetical protein
MSDLYANITLQGPETADVVTYLKAQGVITYVAPAPKQCTIVFHEDYGSQERVASELSSHFQCPALLVMVFNRAILLYHLYNAGKQIDAYVSSPHEGLELDGPAPEGNAAVLSSTFGAERREASVERVLRKPTKPETDYAYAVNRHGELARALGLSLFVAGTGFGQIESGELPHGTGFDMAGLTRTGQ